MATQRVAISDSGYQLVASGACVIDAEQLQDVYVHFGAAAPGDVDTPARHLIQGPGSFVYSGTENAYVRTVSGPGAVIVTEMS